MNHPVIGRTALRFSPSGAFASCLALTDDGERRVELWMLSAAGPALLRTGRASMEPSLTQIVVRDDGRVVVSWNVATEQRIACLDDGDELETLGASKEPFRLVPAPVGVDAVAVAATRGSAGVTLLRPIRRAPRWLGPEFRLPGRLGGLAVAGRHLAATVFEGHGPRPSLVDLNDGSVAPLLRDAGAAAHVLLAGGGVVLLGLEAGSGHRLGTVSTNEPGLVAPVTLTTPVGSPVTPLAIDPTGTMLAVRVGGGVRDSLIVHNGHTEEVLVTPTGPLAGQGGWTGHGLWFCASTPTCPDAFAWVPAGGRAVHWTETDADWSAARTEWLPGAAGPIEAVSYGADWRAGGPVVLALHGGPSAHVTLAFSRPWQHLVRAGISVIATNHRGSTGYGHAHADAIRGAWGGPDLADILAVGRHLVDHRPAAAPRPALYGTSYGAFLALLAAAAAPYEWSACAAIAGFPSVPALYTDGTAPVRRMIDRLDGQATMADTLGARDLGRLAARIVAPVFVAHGELDEVIPVAHGRALARALQLAGHPDVTYRELPNRGHAGIGERAGDPALAELIRFLHMRIAGARTDLTAAIGTQ